MSEDSQESNLRMDNISLSENEAASTSFIF